MKQITATTPETSAQKLLDASMMANARLAKLSDAHARGRLVSRLTKELNAAKDQVAANLNHYGEAVTTILNSNNGQHYILARLNELRCVLAELGGSSQTVDCIADLDYHIRNVRTQTLKQNPTSSAHQADFFDEELFYSRRIALSA
jgi:hypothetical protein